MRTGDVFPFRNNIIVSNDNNWRFILCFQVIGIIGVACLLIKSIKKNYLLKFILVLLSFIVCLATAFAVYFAFTFNPQIG